MLTIEQMKEQQLTISTEALSNPLSPINEILKSKFANIVSAFSNIFPHKKKEVNSHYIIKLSNAEKKINVVKRYGYVPLADIKVPVVEGLFGSTIEFSKAINNGLSISDTLLKETLKPLHDLILSLIGDPTKLSKLDANEFKNIKTYDEQITECKTEIKKHLNPVKNIQTRAFKELYPNLGEFQRHITFCKNQLYPEYVKTAEQRIQIVSTMQEISKSLDLLMLRIEQKPETFNINSFNLNKLAGIVISVAEVVEFVGSMQVYADMQLSLILHSWDKIYSIAEELTNKK